MTFNSSDDYKKFSDDLPDHECIGEGCPQHAGGYLYVIEQGDEYRMLAGTHGLSVSTAIEACIEFIDAMVVHNAPDGMPPALAFTQGREYIRIALEQLPPPDEIREEMQGFLGMMDALRKVREDGVPDEL